ncbi:RING finger protein 24-like [Lingula anatina]|uniref:RING finger protein 24-like n=1 Tax=Lingula anatina TaxID=7574 RepID=A0A1S3JJN3_LINAN|nr:RING finger protein 24-like [Lingula anatina]|eukprot:XP_013410592.1 RING finger protein 24-like [Lingula anatina]
MDNIPVKYGLPLIAVGGVVLIVCLLFCCYLWKLRRDAVREFGYKMVVFKEKKKKSFPNDVCPVCLDEFKLKEKIALCLCRHAFHLKCLLQWLEQRNSCPMCNTQVRRNPNERSGLVANADSYA